MIAVTGITGHSGGFLLQQFIDNNYSGTLRCLVRESTKTERLTSSGLNIELFYGNIDSVDDLTRFVDGADTVIHIAGIWKTLGLLEAISRVSSVKHIILVHTTGIYSKHKMASDEYKEIEAKMQKYLDSGMNITILRPTMIFGDMRDHNISKFIKMVAKFPLMPEIDHGVGLIQPVNARDLGQAYYKAAMVEKLPQLSYNISGERELTIHELLTLIGQYMGKKTRFISAPMWLGVFGAKAVKLFSGGKVDLVEKVLRLGEDRNFSHADATRDFGYEPASFNQGLQREVNEFLSQRNS
jgi:nucleoside-diphosphate-sugar epimerase